MAAAALFGTPPTATYAEAMEHYQRSEDRGAAKGEPWVACRLALARVAHKMGRHADARAWCERAATLKRLPEDEKHWKELEALRAKLR